MSRLLSADFAKLKKNKFFWICTIGLFLFGVFMAAMHHIAMIQQNDDPHLTNVLFVYALVVAILIPAFVSLFIGTEYSDGTVRNKLVIGHTRQNIYLSSLISSSTAGLIFCLSYLAGALLVGVPLTGIEEGTLQGIVILVLLSLLMSGAFTALCTITALLCQNRALTVVINILSACFLLVMSIYVMNKLLEPETYMGTYLDTSTGKITAGEEIKNPDYLEGTERDIYQFFNDFLPTGQSVNISQAGGVSGNPGLMAAYSAGIIIVSTGIGIFSFKKRDIK